jgi:hypothetical protein
MSTIALENVTMPSDRASIPRFTPNESFESISVSTDPMSLPESAEEEVVICRIEGHKVSTSITLA